MVDALVKQTGTKGELLEAAMRSERGKFGTRQFAEIQLEAMAWATQAADQLFEGAPATPSARAAA
jgi:hypothetical protein